MPLGKVRPSSIRRTSPPGIARYTPLNGSSLAGDLSRSLRPYGGSVNQIDPSRASTRSLGELKRLPLYGVARNVFVLVLRSRRAIALLPLSAIRIVPRGPGNSPFEPSSRKIAVSLPA